MSHSLWHRYLTTGEALAVQPALFPCVVAFLEAVATDNEARALVVRVFELSLDKLTTRQLAELLCQVEPRLTELETALDSNLEHMSVADRRCAAQWALFALRDHNPTIPGGVAQLLAMLHNPREPAT